jgi:predicted amidohydrolase
MLTVVPGDGSGHEAGKDSSPLIDEIVREGARRMLAEALQAEVDAYIAAHAAERDGNGRRLVVRNGYHQSQEVLTSAGAVEVTVPRVNDKRTDPDTGERKRFSSAILPPWCRVRVSAFRPEWMICGYDLGIRPLGVPQRPSRCPAFAPVALIVLGLL